MIDKFTGQYRFLSNFYPVSHSIRYCGTLFPSVEHAYQAAKSHDVSYHHRLVNCTAGEAKRLGRSADLRHDWDAVKLMIMEGFLLQKFEGELADALKQTYPHQLVEGNTWGDTFWGICNGRGKNHLGLILMSIRASLLGGMLQTDSRSGKY